MMVGLREFAVRRPGRLVRAAFVAGDLLFFGRATDVPARLAEGRAARARESRVFEPSWKGGQGGQDGSDNQHGGENLATHGISPWMVNGLALWFHPVYGKSAVPGDSRLGGIGKNSPGRFSRPGSSTPGFLRSDRQRAHYRSLDLSSHPELIRLRRDSGVAGAESLSRDIKFVSEMRHQVCL
jgi:hypothetical protein